LAAWSAVPEMAHLTIGVNVSVRQFRQKEFAGQVLAMLAKTGADPAKLKLELTESILALDIDDINSKMVELKAQGVTFALDDFGTGYSSLAYLKQLPLDELKIDQSFVRDILIDSNDEAIARMIIALAASMGLDVIAEGVETGQQKQMLQNMGCFKYQGYLISKPVAAEQFAALFNA
jgi:EAL domain-containing protein (putative c-di-GMP-specific phosphodiesterase class I)